MALSDILKDTAKFADDYEIPFGEDRIRLGDIRAQLNSAQTEAQQRAAEVAAAQEREAAYQNTLRALEAARSQQSAPPPPPQDQPDPNAELYDDKWTRGFQDRLLKAAQLEIQKSITPFTQQIQNWQQQMNVGTQALTRMLLETRTNQDYRDAGEWPEGYSPVRAFKEAMDKGYIDRTTGTPDIKKLHYELMEPTRVQKAVADAVAQARKDERERLLAEMRDKSGKNMALVSRPNMLRAVPKKGEKAHTLAEWFNSDDANPDDGDMALGTAAANSIFGVR